ncbi:MAG: ABC transporter substrate-binding protein [Treponema sp.]|jgi:iron complex transport system substrate-binding protein|nr:ABC transporter substrate-binding protein [Treponema sp.]
MKKRFLLSGPARAGILFLTALLVLFVGTGCTRDSERSSEVVRIEFNRIISAAPSNTEIITALGMADRLIAVDRYSAGIPGVPGGLPEIDFFYPDTEAIIGLEPDLIVANEINSYGVADNPFKLLGDMGIRVVDIPTSVSIEGIYSDIITIAEVLGVKERGEALVASMKEEITSIAAAAKEAPERKTVYFEISGPPFMYSFGRGNYLNEMIEIAGGRNIFDDQNSWFSPSAEEIITRNPDVIFTMHYSWEDTVAEMKSRMAFQTITAIKENRVYAIDENSASRPSQNIMLALRQMAQGINSP